MLAVVGLKNFWTKISGEARKISARSFNAAVAIDLNNLQFGWDVVVPDKGIAAGSSEFRRPDGNLAFDPLLSRP
jgi:hypothetical protein